MAKPTLNTVGGSLLALGFAGQLTHEIGFTDIDHAVNVNASAVDFGVAVSRSGVDGCKPFAAITDEILGISVRQSTGVYNAGGTVNYPQYSSVPVLKQGYMFVEAGENVTVGDYVVALTASAGKLGGGTGGVPGAGRALVPGGSWETTTAAGQIGKIRINLSTPVAVPA